MANEVPGGLRDLGKAFTGADPTDAALSRVMDDLAAQFKGTQFEPLFPVGKAWDGPLYNFLRYLRGSVQQLADLKPKRGPFYPRSIEFPAPPFVIESLFIDEHGTLRIQRHENPVARLYHDFRDAVDGIDTRRIRSCPVPRCRKFFWANREDQSACSHTCANRLRVSRHYRKKRKNSSAKTRQTKSRIRKEQSR